MLPPHLLPSLVAFRNELSATFGARLHDVVLFGSFARGEASETSDVDVLVLVDGLEQDEITRVADVATRVSLETGVPLSALPFSSERWAEMVASGRGLAREIVRDGARW